QLHVEVFKFDAGIRDAGQHILKAASSRPASAKSVIATGEARYAASKATILKITRPYDTDAEGVGRDRYPLINASVGEAAGSVDQQIVQHQIAQAPANSPY